MPEAVVQGEIPDWSVQFQVFQFSVFQPSGRFVPSCVLWNSL